jgi:hypothetical protein
MMDFVTRRASLNLDLGGRIANKTCDLDRR